MRKIPLLLVLIVFLSGCATLDSIRLVNRQRLLQLSIGMSKQDVLKVMGTKTETDGFQSINNPYRSETLRGENKTLEVLYYYTDIKKSDGAITDDELTPLVFDDGKLIGWGWSFFEDTAKKYEIRIR